MLLRKYGIFFLVMMFSGLLACADISLDDNSSDFTFNVTNSTGGPLATLVFGGTTFENVPSGETRSATFEYPPETEDVT